MTSLGQKRLLEDLLRLRNFFYTTWIRSTWTHYFLSFLIENMSKIENKLFLQCSPIEYPCSASLSSIPTGNDEDEDLDDKSILKIKMRT